MSVSLSSQVPFAKDPPSVTFKILLSLKFKISFFMSFEILANFFCPSFYGAVDSDIFCMVFSVVFNCLSQILCSHKWDHEEL